jgi:hypothetical protein
MPSTPSGSRRRLTRSPRQEAETEIAAPVVVDVVAAVVVVAIAVVVEAVVALAVAVTEQQARYHLTKTSDGK